ncbi:IS4 family transposase [Candidatus Contendibacter odensensis]|uniref:Transposase n=1 Tax=Candidatus Contendobacter odensis Run_B_J11 TaxID=1400861 RepID=A0A7U7GBH6_9GAMM|nr:IS4 family transposase [Candidatus Contendobacter odensis]MBK8755220.1 IS4 family transposase [Candidatus Competibacteraceae bacterium]CDH45368.1 transposase [Candidatus Contendobacter odensis Run_B_J11]
MNWAQAEFHDLELGDERRTQRLIKLVDDRSAQPTGSIPLACGGWPETKAAYRLLDNPAVEWREILEVHTPRTVERMAGQPVVLCIQDTTELDFTSQPGIAGLGRLSYEAQHGLYVHPTLAVTPAGLALGVLDAWMWARKPKDPPDVKESTRWVEGYEIVADRAETVPDSRRVYVADREGDLRALIDAAARRGTPADWLIRSQHNRKTTTGEKLWARLAQSEALGEVEFTLPAAPDRPARLVRQTLYREGVTLPAHHGQPAVTVTAILAREERPPAGEKAIEWRLLTHRTAETLEQVVELIDGYRRRWLVEIFFRIWKSGCQVEALQLATLERLERALVIYLIIAWRILHLVTWGRDCPNLPCDVGFDPEEWQAAWIVAHRHPPPATPPPLGQRVRLIAGFGGFLGRKQDGHPGPKAIWEGMQKVRAFAIALEAGRAVYTGDG